MPESIMLVGGYGVVGAQLARLLRDRHPNLELIIAGRSLERAHQAADRLGARAARVDLNAPDPLAETVRPPSLVVALANDAEDSLLRACLDRSLPYLDITRWTDRLRRATDSLPARVTPTVPVVFASSWMAASVATLARGLARGLRRVERIDLDILYGLNDRSGPNATEYMDRLATPFEVTEGGRRVRKQPLSDGKTTRFPGHGSARLYRFDTPDQLTLPMLTGAGSVSSRIAFSGAGATRALMLLVRSGVWRALSGPAFTSWRHALLHNPGEGDHHRIALEVHGQDPAGQTRDKRLVVDAPDGQTHLTAVGALVQVERMLGRCGHRQAPTGAQYAEAVTDPALLRSTLEALGIVVTEA